MPVYFENTMLASRFGNGRPRRRRRCRAAFPGHGGRLAAIFIPFYRPRDRGGHRLRLRCARRGSFGFLGRCWAPAIGSGI
jgi:hypothetical protein